MKAIIPTVFIGVDLSRVILFVFLLVSSISLASMADKNHQRYNMYMNRTKLAAIQSMSTSSKKAIEVEHLQKELAEQVKSTKDADSASLMCTLVEVRRKLDSMKRHVAFLSVDVVDSTGMKKLEDPIVVQHSFNEYKKFLSKIFADCGELKSSWTPDGVMVCFPSAEHATCAAKEIIAGLPVFNSTVSGMSRPFEVRCGINAGAVLYDEAVPMSEMSDAVIDVTGHMQKYAQPDSIFMSSELAGHLGDKYCFRQTDKMVDGFNVCMLLPNSEN